MQFASALDQHFNAVTNEAIRAEYNSPDNICRIYTTGDNTAFRIRTDEEVQIKYNESGNTMNEIINNIITPSPVYTKNNSMHCLLYTSDAADE